MEKVIRDGKVGVLISEGYGSGFYSYNANAPEELIYNPTLINFIELEDYELATKFVEVNYPNVYTGGIEDLVVKWVPQGKRFRIKEYDGLETIELEEEVQWLVA